MRGKRAKAIRQMATNQWVAAVMQQKGENTEVPGRALVCTMQNRTTAINHPQSLRAMYRLMKKSWKQFSRCSTRGFA